MIIKLVLEVTHLTMRSFKNIIKIRKNMVYGRKRLFCQTRIEIMNLFEVIQYTHTC